MALNLRFVGKRILSCHALRPASQYRTITLQPRPYQPPIEEGYDEKNMRLNRPQSPHLTIYKPQLTSMLSISHRITGMVLSGYAAAFATASLLSNKPMVELVQSISQNHPAFFLLFKVGLIFPFTYHFFNGIRHLVWDGGKSLTIPGVYQSGYIMLAAAGVSGIALYFF